VTIQSIITDNLPDEFFYRALAGSFSSLVEKALLIAEGGVLCLGEGYKYYIFTSAAHGFVLARTGATMEEAQQLTIDRSKRLLYKILAAQEPLPKGVSTYATVRILLLTNFKWYSNRVTA
jgi:hypothetical protein